MPIDPITALNGLRRQVPGSAIELPDTDNPELQHYALLQQLKEEADKRALMASRIPGDPDQAAFQGLSNYYGGNLAKTEVEKQRPILKEFEDAQRQASLAGFGDQDMTLPSQRAGQYARNIEQQKIMAPGKAAVDAARVKAAGDVEVAQAGAKPYNRFLDIVQGGGDGNGLGPGDSASMGGMSIHRGSAAKDPVSSNLLGQLATARAAVEKAKSGFSGFFPGAGGAEQARVDQLVADVLSQHPASNGIKDLAHQIVSNPKTSGLSMSQIMQRVGGDQMDANEANQLRDILSILRGKDF